MPKKPDHYTQPEWRAEMYQRVKAKPRLHLWYAFGISRNSSRKAVVDQFEECAAGVGVSIESAQSHAYDFMAEKGVIPEYMLQCCSGKLAGQYD